MKKIGQVFYGLVPILVYFMVQMIITLIAGAVVVLINGDSDYALSSEFIMLVSCISLGVLTVILSIWYCKAYVQGKKPILSDLFTIKNISIIIIMAFSLQISISFLFGVLQAYRPSWFVEYTEIMGLLDMGNNLMSFLYIVILGPVVEELLMRGLVLHQMKRAMPFVAANIVQAFLFALIHGNLIQGLYAFVLGLLFGYVYRKFNTIWSTILFHVIFNFSGFLLDIILSDTVTFSTTVMLIIVAITFVIGLISTKVLLSGSRNLETMDKIQ